LNRKILYTGLSVVAAVCIISIVVAIVLSGHWSSRVRLDGTPHEIVPGVFYLGDISPAAVYAIKGPDGIVLIDSGRRSSVSRVLNTLSRLGLNARELRAILLTHRHSDHASGADTIRQTTGARIYAGAADAAVLKDGGATEDFHSFFPVVDAPLLQFDIDVRIETTSELNIAGVDLTAILCPGHTAGGVCYLLRRAGHTVLFGGTR
jgi:glyoxylase-like metal-dependent hydrolase (beta-lactamase superfamily II)